MSKKLNATLAMVLTISSIYGCKGRNVGPAKEDATIQPGPGLEVSLDESSPEAMMIPRDLSSLLYSTFAFKPVDGNVTIIQIVLTRQGLGNASDFNAVRIYLDDVQISSSQTFSTTSNSARFSIEGQTLIADQTYLFDTRGDMVAPPNSENQICITRAEDIVAVDADTNEPVEIIGEFPICGNTMTTTAATIGVLEYTATYPEGNTLINIGDTNIHFMNVQIDNNVHEDVIVDPIVFDQYSIPYWATDRVTLWQEGQLIGEITDILSGEVSFPEAFFIPNGGSVSFELRGDMINTDMEDLCQSVQWRFDEIATIATGLTYGFSLEFRRSLDWEDAPSSRFVIADAAYFYAYDQTPTIANPTPPGSQDAPIAQLALETGMDCMMEGFQIQIEFGSAADIQYFSNIKLENLDQGWWSTVSGPWDFTPGACVNEVCTFNVIDQFNIEQCKGGIRATINTAPHTPPSAQVRFKLLKQTVSMSRTSNGSSVNLEDIHGDDVIAGQWIQIAP